MSRGSESPRIVLVEDDEAHGARSLRAPEGATSVLRSRAESCLGFSGEIAVGDLAELVQLVVMVTRSGALHVRTAAGCGTIWFEQGAIVHAAVEGGFGSAAFQSMLRWPGGSFAIDSDAIAPEQTIAASTTALLLDAACALDEEDASGIRACEDERAAEHFESGLQAIWHKDYAGALPEWERATELEPDNRLYQHNLVRLRRLMESDRAQR